MTTKEMENRLIQQFKQLDESFYVAALSNDFQGAAAINEAARHCYETFLFYGIVKKTSDPDESLNAEKATV